MVGSFYGVFGVGICGIATKIGASRQIKSPGAALISPEAIHTHDRGTRLWIIDENASARNCLRPGLPFGFFERFAQIYPPEPE
jgi:hypothetical protein